MVRIILKSVDILRRSTTTREEFGEIDDEIFEKKKSAHENIPFFLELFPH